MTDDLVERLRGPVQDAAHAFINDFFNNKDTPKPEITIPAKEDNSDLTLVNGIREASDAIEALQAEQCVEVTALEWGKRIQKERPIRFITNSTCGRYQVTEWLDGSGYVVCFMGRFGRHERIEAPTSAGGSEPLKAAAQADYEQRILSTITTRPASEVRAEAHAAAVEAAARWLEERAKMTREAAEAQRSVSPESDPPLTDEAHQENLKEVFRLNASANLLMADARVIKNLHTDASREYLAAREERIKREAREDVAHGLLKIIHDTEDADMLRLALLEALALIEKEGV